MIDERIVRTPSPWLVLTGGSAAKKRILCTGNAGFIGSHVADLLISEGYHVTGIDNLSTGSIDNVSPEVDFYELDITNETFVLSLDDRFDAIVHLAAQPSLLESELYPAMDAETNILGTIRVLQYAKWIHCDKFIFASTSAVHSTSFGSHVICPEEAQWDTPNRPYGMSKYAAEMYVRSLSPNPIITRFANVYGQRQVPLGENQLIPRALDHIYNDAPFEIYGSGNQSRDFIHVEDVARAILYAIEKTQIVYNPVINISSGKSTSVNEVLEMLKSTTKWKGDFTHGDAKKDEPMHIIMDNSKAKKVLGWYPRISLNEGLKRTVNWWKNNG